MLYFNISLKVTSNQDVSKYLFFNCLNVKKNTLIDLDYLITSNELEKIMVFCNGNSLNQIHWHPK